MSYLVLQSHANERIVLTANPDAGDENLIQGIAVCVTRTGEKTVSLGISAPESILILRAELLEPCVL
ncbi:MULTISPECIES: carbon storage regulator [Pseudomonas]|uniref:carbon storage regulator n=1 Tax=Pseudomonas TaxID=286 RepID=UPI00053E8EB0|nr:MULTISPECIES: carbon storage regulator [Pseudomonas]QFZ61324.1 carbon storage regulator [Pseudomonas aeruginosa PA99]ALV75901.1 Global regulator protein family protein [Pseudomonas aeruginosa]EIU1416144.1 carbon storage regulator [Pseudomonas aeruginosa]EKU3791084.1 carbon storage regulator [Pseudomonas aeruginosa]EKV3151389.1 carbon storage regulator [Pseudomonas aeruginosa]